MSYSWEQIHMIFMVNGLKKFWYNINCTNYFIKRLLIRQNWKLQIRFFIYRKEHKTINNFFLGEEKGRGGDLVNIVSIDKIIQSQVRSIFHHFIEHTRILQKTNICTNNIISSYMHFKRQKGLSLHILNIKMYLYITRNFSGKF